MGSISLKKQLLRKKQILKRKNFLPTFLFTGVLWLALVGIVYFIDPESFGAIPLFFLIFFMASLFTSSIIFESTRRGMLSALSLTVFLFLSFLGVGNIINFLLIAGIAIAFELYFTKN